MISSVGQYTNNLTMTMTIKTSKSNLSGAFLNLVSKELANYRIAFFQTETIVSNSKTSFISSYVQHFSSSAHQGLKKPGALKTVAELRKEIAETGMAIY
jgi:hypothetical protein